MKIHSKLSTTHSIYKVGTWSDDKKNETNVSSSHPVPSFVERIVRIGQIVFEKTRAKFGDQKIRNGTKTISSSSRNRRP